MADHKDLQRAYYDEVYKANLQARTNGDVSANIKHYFVNRFLDRVVSSSGQTVLEIGCGDGTLTEYLLGRQLRVQAIDISPEAIACLRTKFSDFIVSEQLAAHCGDVLDHLREHQGFDLIIGAGIIHHIEKDERADFFKAVCHALNPSGTFACAPEPNANGLYRRLWRSAGWVYQKVYHIPYDQEVEKGTLEMRSKSLIQDLKLAGFADADVLPYQVLPHFSSKWVALADRKLIEHIGGKWALYTVVRASK